MNCSTNSVAFEKQCKLTFAFLTRRNCQREIRNFSRFGFNCNSIPFKKYKCSDGACTLVSIDEGVIHDDVKKICSCRLKRKCVQVGSATGRSRLFDCGLKQIGITNINRATVIGNLVNVNLHHIAVRWCRFHGQVSLLK